MKELQVLELASKKGFEAINDFITGDFLVLCSIQKWLMDKHSIYITVAKGFGGFSYFVQHDDSPLKPHSFGGHKTWLEAFKTALKEALNLIK